MANQIVPTKPFVPESTVCLAGGSSSARQLRKSCRFCRSRKIRCSGETDTGCSACRNRGQQCIYEPTAAMGRPRKYPRTESSCGHPSSLMDTTTLGTGALQRFSRSWENVPEYPRPLDVASFKMGQNIPLEEANPTSWKTNTEACTNSFIPNLTSLPPSYRTMPYSPMFAASESHNTGLDPTAYRSQGDPFQSFGVANPSSNPPNSINAEIYRATGDLAQIPEHVEIDPRTSLPHRVGFPPQELSYTSQAKLLSIESTENHSVLGGHQGSPQSSPSFLANDSTVSYGTHQLIYTCNASAIFQHFNGVTLNIATQAHLEFILCEYPNLGLFDPSFSYPTVTDPNLYNTMIADVVSLLTTSKPSVPDLTQKLNSSPELLFIQILNSDRGGNRWPDSSPTILESALNPLDDFSPGELKLIYSQWLLSNPFSFIFSNPELNFQLENNTYDRALLAAIAGWHFYVTSKKDQYNESSSMKTNLQLEGLRSYMKFFDYAENELMKRTIGVNDLTPSTVQALILLAAFRSIDFQPRCGWALLNVAYLLSREYLKKLEETKRTQDLNTELDVEGEIQDEKMLGLYWLLCIYRSWSLISMKFSEMAIHTSLIGLPCYLDAYLSNTRLISSFSHSQVNNQWVNRMLLESSQILEVFCTVCRENSSNKSASKTSGTPFNTEFDAKNLYVIRWLIDTAEVRCKTFALPESSTGSAIGQSNYALRESHNLHANPVLAVAFGIFALNGVIPFRSLTPTRIRRLPMFMIREMVKVLRMISNEVTGAILVPGASLENNSHVVDSKGPSKKLLVKILRGAFPYLMIIFQAAVDSLPVFGNLQTSDYANFWNQLLELTEAFRSFISIGISLNPAEDLDAIERLRGNIGSCPNGFLAQQDKINKDPSNLRSPIPGPMLRNSKSFSDPFPNRSQRLTEDCKKRDMEQVMEGFPLSNDTHQIAPTELVTYCHPSNIGSIESISHSQKGNSQPVYVSSTGTINCVPSPPLSSDPASSASHFSQASHLNLSSLGCENAYQNAEQTTDFLIAGSQKTFLENELNQTGINSGLLLGSQIEETQPAVQFNSSWLSQAPVDPIGHTTFYPTTLNFGGLQIPTTKMNPLANDLCTPPGYPHHEEQLNFITNTLELRTGSLDDLLLSGAATHGFSAPETSATTMNFVMKPLNDARSGSKLSTSNFPS
ncbi:hypothetical protein O181_037913 [Austropuccinia psidii MF-1]|uniref:Zn(2)-C6 fungal-type domain-containing protein n=1 Tax=Austropuccinia psidii MF-1 TaxID=1389203 RepID=A0A9Q3DAF0_9BASI|nr:hypothetical protein [Austropuccinia psidii MF-1]